MVVGFIFWWPLGLATLFFILWSKGMICWSQGGPHWQHKMERMRSKMEHFGSGWGGPPSSGNHAFDEYRTETLRRLEEEQREFREFLERLRFARDKTEFDQFMAERRAVRRPHRLRLLRRRAKPRSICASQPSTCSGRLLFEMLRERFAPRFHQSGT
jgi:hypothetical protein